MSQLGKTVVVMAVLIACLSMQQTVYASETRKGGFTAVAGTDKAVFDERKKNNTALAVAAGVGTLALFAVGLTATKKRTKLL